MFFERNCPNSLKRISAGKELKREREGENETRQRRLQALMGVACGCVVVDGSWAQWSKWSSCGPDCRQHRTRSCDSPAPFSGGKFCLGDNNLESANCTGGMCRGSHSSFFSFWLGFGFCFCFWVWLLFCPSAFHPCVDSQIGSVEQYETL